MSIWQIVYNSIKMRPFESPSSTKTTKIRSQLRHKQIHQLFSTHRHQLPPLSKPQSQKTVQSHLKTLQKLLNDPSCNLYNNPHIQILIKQLRDISCEHEVPELFHVYGNLSVVVQMVCCGRFDRVCLGFLYQVLLNVSAARDQDIFMWDTMNKYAQHVHLPLHLLKLEEMMADNRGQLMQLCLKIMGNMIQKDKTSKTTYFLLTKPKLLKICIKILIDRKQIYRMNKLQQIFLWFTNKLIISINQFKFQKIDEDYENFVTLVQEEILRVFWDCWQRDHGWGTTDGKGDPGDIQVNDVLLYIRTGIKVGALEVTQLLISKIQRYFSPTNLYYIDLLGTLTCRTLYSLPLPHMQSLLDQLLSHPTNPHSPNLLRCLTNSLINDSTEWKTVLQYFINYSQKQPPQSPQSHPPSHHHDLYLEYSRYGFLMYFMYFLNCSSTERDIAEVIGIVVCGQGGLGVFQGGMDGLGQSAYLLAKLESYGFDIQIQ